MILGNCVHCSSKSFVQKELNVNTKTEIQKRLLSNIDDGGDINEKKIV